MATLDLYIIGTGKTAELIYQYTRNSYVIHFADEEKVGQRFFNRTIIHPNDIPKLSTIFIAIGVNKLNTIRQRVYEEFKQKGYYKFLTYVHPNATVMNTAKIGEHCFIMEENVIQDYVSIGNNNILWSGNHIGHHTHIGDHNFISSHVVISGSCTIGNNNFFGVNSCLGDEVSVGDFNWFSPLTHSVQNIGDEQLLVLPKEARPVVAKSSTKRYFKVQ